MDIQDVYNLIVESAIGKFTGAGVIFCTKKGKVLVLKKNNKLWCLPGGKPEQDELPRQTAIRETEEETGKTPYNLKGPIVLTNKNKTYYSFISIINDVFDVDVSNEHKDYSWVGMEDLKKLNLLPPFKANLKQITKFIKKEIEKD